MGKRKRNDAVGGIMGLGATSIGLAVTGRAVAASGGNTGGLTNAAAFLPGAGSIVGAKAVLGDLAKFRIRKRS